MHARWSLSAVLLSAACATADAERVVALSLQPACAGRHRLFEEALARRDVAAARIQVKLEYTDCPRSVADDDARQVDALTATPTSEPAEPEAKTASSDNICQELLARAASAAGPSRVDIVLGAEREMDNQHCSADVRRSAKHKFCDTTNREIEEKIAGDDLASARAIVKQRHFLECKGDVEFLDRIAAAETERRQRVVRSSRLAVLFEHVVGGCGAGMTSDDGRAAVKGLKVLDDRHAQCVNADGVIDGPDVDFDDKGRVTAIRWWSSGRKEGFWEDRIYAADARQPRDGFVAAGAVLVRDRFFRLDDEQHVTIPRGQALHDLCVGPGGAKRLGEALDGAYRACDTSPMGDHPVPGAQQFFRDLLGDISGERGMTQCVRLIATYVGPDDTDRLALAHLQRLHQQDDAAAWAEYQALPSADRLRNKENDELLMPNAMRLQQQKLERAKQAGAYKANVELLAKEWCDAYQRLRGALGNGGVCAKAAGGGPAYVECERLEQEPDRIQRRAQALGDTAFREVGVDAQIGVAGYYADLVGECAK